MCVLYTEAQLTLLHLRPQMDVILFVFQRSGLVVLLFTSRWSQGVQKFVFRKKQCLTPALLSLRVGLHVNMTITPGFFFVLFCFL